MEKRKSMALFLLLTTVSFAYAQWNDCPFGLKNDTYPGHCGRYVDTNRDGICDHSQEKPATAPDPKTTTTSLAAPATTNTAAKQNTITTKYNVVPITAALFILYLISVFLTDRKIISVVVHRKIWNLILTLSFIPTAASAVLIALKMDLGWDIPMLAELLFWHTEIGLIMVWTASFHILWHWRYYLAYIKK